MAWRCFQCGAEEPFKNNGCRYYRMHFILRSDYQERALRMPMYVVLDSPMAGAGTIEEFRKYVLGHSVRSNTGNTGTEEKTMRLEMAILAGEESKKFLSGLTTQIDRLEKLADKLGQDKAPSEEAPAKEVEDDEDEDFSAKPTKGKAKKAAKSFDEDEETEAEKEPEETEEESEDDEDEEEDKPAKKAKAAAKVKKVSADDVNDACKKHAKSEGRDATLKLLKKKFGVQSVTELKPEQYDDVIKAVAIEDDEE